MPPRAAAALAAIACRAGPAGDPAEPGCRRCALGDDANYHYEASLVVEETEVEALADVVIDWSGLDVDLQGHPLDPYEDVDLALLVVFPGLGPAEVAAGLASETLDQSDVAMFVTCSSPEARCSLGEFSVMGSAFDPSDYFVPDRGAWLVVLQSLAEAGALAMSFLVPTEDASRRSVAITGESSALSVSVDLLGLAPLLVEGGTPDLELDWSGATVDGLGNPLSLQSVDELWLARFSEDLEQLEERIFDIEDIATDLWRAGVAGQTAASLADLEGPTPFAGVDDEGTWLLALWCTACLTPAPRILTVLRSDGAPD